jgi:D-alanyl-lipoteichoic acid acyltransferase DltB (MBOAT superfamily)
MYFHSIDFALFLPIVFVLYWFVCRQSIKAQNILLLLASYVFYGWWDWRFLGLIIFSTGLDFVVAQAIAESPHKNRQKLWLWVSLSLNLGLLCVFKYFNFFIDNFVAAFNLLGYNIPESNLNLILPVGISFYTFQTLSYTIDVYRGKMQASKDFIAFAAFVAFFPQLVAGPIERASHLLPQFLDKRPFDAAKATDGLRQILWGLVKKIVIADNCAEYANQIFNHSGEQNGMTLLLGAMFFAFQIYGDFSGYSDIAIGVARLFGFDLMRNFAFPYFSRDIAEFWRRWHISLTTWFRDYLYIPLGGSRGNKLLTARNTLIIFLVSGFWHGANWTFVYWGAFHAVLFLPLLLTGKHRNQLNTVAAASSLPTLRELFQMLLTFISVCLGWIFFRSTDLPQALDIFSTIFSASLFSKPHYWSTEIGMVLAGFVLLEWRGRLTQHPLAVIGMGWSRPLRWGFYCLLLLLLWYFAGTPQEFIYFQF